MAYLELWVGAKLVFLVENLEMKYQLPYNYSIQNDHIKGIINFFRSLDSNFIEIGYLNDIFRYYIIISKKLQIIL